MAWGNVLRESTDKKKKKIFTSQYSYLEDRLYNFYPLLCQGIWVIWFFVALNLIFMAISLALGFFFNWKDKKPTYVRYFCHLALFYANFG